MIAFTENPHITQESAFHPQKLTVWVAICSTSVIGPFFDETVDHKKYIEVLKKFLTKAQKEEQIDEHWFMQNGAAPHRHKDVLNLLNPKFENCVIALSTCFAWPPCSPDLNPYDFDFE